MAIHAVLLIPGPGHEGLLSEGPCGARPPTANHMINIASGKWRWVPWLPEFAPEALVLAWDGETVPMGCLAAFPVSAKGFEFLDLLDGVHTRLSGGDPHWAIRVPEGCTIVLLDEDGREVHR